MTHVAGREFPHFSGSQESLSVPDADEEEMPVLGNVRVCSVQSSEAKESHPPWRRGEILNSHKSNTPTCPNNSRRPKHPANKHSSFMIEGKMTLSPHREWNQARLIALKAMRATLEAFKSVTRISSIDEEEKVKIFKYIENREERVVLLYERSSIRIEKAELLERKTSLNKQLAKLGNLDYWGEYWIDRYGKKWKPTRSERDEIRIANDFKISSLQQERRELDYEFQRLCKSLDEIKIKICTNERVEEVETLKDPTLWIRYDGYPELKLRW